jgi:hypothetical protein
VDQTEEAERLLAAAAELRIRASQLAMTAESLIRQGQQLSAEAAVLYERARRLMVQEDTKH